MPIGTPKIESHTHQHDMAEIDRLARVSVEDLMQLPTALVEQALLWAYINIAPGVKLYPAETQMERAALLLNLISTDIVQRIIKVGTMTEAEVQAGLSRASGTSH